MPVIVQALYLGLMTFFILSGYFYRPNRGFKNNMVKRLKQIGVPLIICAITLPLVLYIWLLINGYDLPISDYLDSVVYYLGFSGVFTDTSSVNVMTSLTNVDVGVYFILAMLGGFLVFYALADRVMDDARKVAVTIIGLLVVSMLLKEFLTIKLPAELDLAPLAAAFMFVGALLSKIKFIENVEYGEKKRLRYWVLPIICLIAGLVMCYILPPDIRFDHRFFGDYGSLSIIPFFIEAVLMFVPVVYIGFFFSKIPGLSAVFDGLGKHTLAIILVHAFVIKMVIAPFYTVDPLILVPEYVPMGLRLAVIPIALVVSSLIGYFSYKVYQRAVGAKDSKTEAK